MVAALLVVVWPVITGGSRFVSRGLTNNAATTTLQGKTRGCYCSCKFLMMGVEVPETC